jgi:hypothetical protein
MIAVKESLQVEINSHREYWAEIARSNGWYFEPFYIHVWVDDKGEIVDSVSYRGLDRDIVDSY